jgi:acyl carrier protein
MTDAEIIQLINRGIVEEFELDPNLLKSEARLVEDLGFDSLDFVDIAVVLQQSFGINLRDEPSVSEIRTLGDLHQLIIARQCRQEENKTIK